MVNDIIQVNEEKTFGLIYTMKNVAKKYSDIGELYYTFLGSENDTPIDFFAVNITLPEEDIDNKVKIFAHGPLNGEIHKLSDHTIYLKVEDVPKDTFVEARILFPRSFIPTSQNSVDEDAYSNIMEEEARLEQKIEEDLLKREARGVLFGNIAVILAIIEIILFTFLMMKYRRLKDIHEERKYLEVPEDCTPAITTYITSTAISTNTIMATILDLYRRGYVRVDDGEEYEEKKEVLKHFTITRVKEEDEGLLSHEKHFIAWLIEDMGDGATVTTKDIESYSKNNQSMFVKQYTKWGKLLEEDAINKGYFDEGSKKYGLPLLILFPITLILAIVALVYENLLGLMLVATSFLILIQGIGLLLRKSDYGYVEYKRWIAFKRHMKNLKKRNLVDDLGNYPKDIALVYGLALGIDNDILNEFNIETGHREGSVSYGYGWMYWYFILNNNKNNAFQKSIALPDNLGG
ncbi:membrane protein-like protein [Alkaliphilus metalliredigens QYMF]|uniref:Membrane protein-like protein n=1 Tax=Alkaliphilus metalliredigens (strain QYMF) TaxID=293826 RepID=A6TSG3_ALKMQ|nr:DUF2207 domain-containing protein [Alkaliphilus metalliredigens]ABR49131.1 membrane protein-like protein [Alkaliphilus metalliredigens QYMF]